ncbi:MAG TPA: DUF5989 family protein [bacterium]|nr:DUF5989 family protein [bacterium]
MAFFKEFLQFLKERKLWWLAPIIIVLMLLAVIVLLIESSPAVAPFIYTIF